MSEEKKNYYDLKPFVFLIAATMLSERSFEGLFFSSLIWRQVGEGQEVLQKVRKGSIGSRRVVIIMGWTLFGTSFYG